MEMKGAILDLPFGSELDYRLGNDTSYKGIPIKLLPNIESNDTCLNQLEFEKDFGNCLCTLYAGKTMYINNAKKDIDDKNRFELARQRVGINFDKNVGGYLSDGVKLVIDYTGGGIMYRIEKKDIKTLLDKGYVVNIGIYTGADTNTASKDGKLTSEEIDKIINAKYGHSTCLRKNTRLNSYEGVIANNKVEIEDIDKYLKSWFVYTWAYVIVPNYVLRDIYLKFLNGKNQLVGQAYYDKIQENLYPREKKIFQWCLQKKYIGKINSIELKSLVF